MAVADVSCRGSRVSEERAPTVASPGGENWPPPSDRTWDEWRSWLGGPPAARRNGSGSNMPPPARTVAIDRPTYPYTRRPELAGAEWVAPVGGRFAYASSTTRHLYVGSRGRLEVPPSAHPRRARAHGGPAAWSLTALPGVRPGNNASASDLPPLVSDRQRAPSPPRQLSSSLYRCANEWATPAGLCATRRVDRFVLSDRRSSFLDERQRERNETIW